MSLRNGHALLRAALICLLLSPLPLLFEVGHRRFRLAEAPLWVLAALHIPLALWIRRGGYIGYGVGLFRNAMASLILGYAAYSLTQSYYRQNEQAPLLAIAALLSLASLGLLVLPSVRKVLAERRAERPKPQGLVSLRLLGFSALLAVVCGIAEQALLYGHLSVLECTMRPIYLFLPFLGALLFSHLGGIAAVAFGAFVFEVLSDVLSQLLSTTIHIESLLTSLIMPIATAPAVLLGLSLGIARKLVGEDRKRAWIYIPALLLGNVAYREAAAFAGTQVGLLPMGLLLSALYGAGIGAGALVFLDRRSK